MCNDGEEKRKEKLMIKQKKSKWHNNKSLYYHQ